MYIYIYIYIYIYNWYDVLKSSSMGNVYQDSPGPSAAKDNACSASGLIVLQYSAVPL